MGDGPHLLRGGRLADGRLVDVEVADGRIAAVVEAVAGPAPEGSVEELAGWLLVPALAEPHAHLDKALTS